MPPAMKQTPMLQQYLELKALHRDAVLLYRLGDFYELFFEDAERAAPVLGIVLTRRRHNEGVESPMCGIPHHAMSTYVGKLLDAGFKVAVAEQLEDPAAARGLVRRGVTRVLTPGTVTEPELLGKGERRWLASVVRSGGQAAIAYLEAASGDFGGATAASDAELHELLAQLLPREVLLPEGATLPAGAWRPEPGVVVTLRPPQWFEPGRGDELLKRCLGVASLRAFQLDPGDPLVGAAGALLEYMRSTQGSVPTHVGDFRRRVRRGDMTLDAATVRNLELVRDSSGERRGSLLRVLDATVTAMGSRLLRDWLLRPTLDAAAASARHDAVAALIEDPALLASLRDELRALGDLERAAARLGVAQARPGELAALRAALASVPALRGELAAAPAALLAALAAQADDLADLRADLSAVLAEDPPAISGPGMVRAGVDPELDDARRLSHGAKEVLGEVEARERARTGIGTLKVRYNRVFGYSFEVSRAYLDRVPPEFVRRQTLAGGERFVTPELEELERRITGAEAEAEERERALFTALLQRCAGRAQRVAATARALAAVDVLTAFAERARRHGYVRPRLVTGARLRLTASRHPVIEELVASAFVPNDAELDREQRQIVLLTGPNMGGKSTYLRQVALAVIMAWSGSFVAAEEAEIGGIDRVFTRVGAADDIARGESTFMVEMTEVANILRNATASSLVILDEVGRGTATFDGLSLAWAVVEALHDHARGGARPLVLFATHYHELTDLAHRLERVANASLAVKEWQGDVIFLHRVVPGPADRSYGIHVARLAGVPESVCRRAEEVLLQVERQESKVVDATLPASAPHQLDLFPPPEEGVTRRLRAADLERLTPLDALNLLAQLKQELG
jgi:DNA mismatch repair protein MutS